MILEIRDGQAAGKLERVYDTEPYHTVSWFQERATCTLAILRDNRHQFNMGLLGAYDAQHVSNGQTYRNAEQIGRSQGSID